jgi:predicted nucleic-acid-binding protein
MTSVVVDTNVVLSFLTDRNEAQQAQAASLFDSAGVEARLIIHQQVVTEMVYVLVNHYGQSRQLVRSVVEEFLSFPGVEILDAVRWSRVLKLWPGTHRDFTDAVVADAAMTVRSACVATFDEGFANGLGRFGIATWEFPR